MKTLDEVIKAFEICDETETANCPDCPYDSDCENVPREDLRADALHYLKEYKIKQKMILTRIQACDNREQRLQEEIALYLEAVRNCEKAELKYRQLAQKLGEVGNPPLSWDELRKMEEKPVWLVNTATEEAEWVFVGEWLDDDEMRICRMWRDYAQYISRESYGNIWQAYRKEKS